MSAISNPKFSVTVARPCLVRSNKPHVTRCIVEASTRAGIIAHLVPWSKPLYVCFSQDREAIGMTPRDAYDTWKGMIPGIEWRDT
jgi:hypothetical protein